MNSDVRAEKHRPPGGKQPPGHAPYSRVNQSDDRGSEKSQMTSSSSKEQSDHGPFSIHQSENFPPEPGCDMSNPYYDLAVPSSSSSSYTVDSHWELLKESSRTSDELRHALHLAGWESDDIVRECGIRGWRPQCLQKLANIKAFIFCLCILSMFSGTLIAGYVNSVITTIEKRFEIGSLWSGLIAASVEIGCLVAVVFVSYLGGCRHIPVWIGCGAILQGIGALIFVLPHLLAETYTISGGITVRMNRTHTENMCRTHYSHDMHDNCHTEGSGSWWYIFILVLAQIMVGSGGSPLFTLGTTYIDDHVSPKKAPVYIAFMYATGALGPVLGFALGALMLQFYVDSFSFDTNQLNLTPSDSAWVGAWWGGFIVCGCCLLMTSVPFFAFPKVLKREKAKLVLENKENAAKFLDPEEKRRKADYGKNIKDIPRSVWRLLCNPVYMVLVIGGCCEICIVSGFCVFLPKYLETQFGISKSAANLLTGGIAIPGAVFGIMIGGYLLKRCQLSERGAMQMTIIFNIMALFGFTVLIFLGCDNVKMAGATLPYFNSSGHEIEQANLTSPCNMDCACSSNDIEPVCGINGITYFSPCHAGCTQLQSYSLHPMRMQNYSDCACIHDILPSVSNEVIMSPLATSGPCKNTCRRLLPFMVMLFVMTFLVAGAQMPLLMVTLRCVAEEERAFALGMQFVILRLFGYIPAPLLFGKIIDSSCLLWKEKCGSQGACLLYNIVHFRFKYIGVSFGLELVGAVFFVAVLALIWKKSRLSDTNNIQDETERPMSPTTISDNISVNNLSTKESADPQSPTAVAAGDKDVTDPGDLAAALLDPDESLDTASIKGVAGESSV